MSIGKELFLQPAADANAPENPQLAVLKQHFPDCFDKNGAFLPGKLAETLRAGGVETRKEFYTLNWLGKSYAKMLAHVPPNTLLAENTAHNQRAENAASQNLLIKGDNLEVLKHLKNAYRGAVKMIYIDPPYNTGSDGFVYHDDRTFTPEQLAELGGMDVDEAKRVLDFTAKKSNSHSAWLTFMYPRLYVARELLRDDGVIFISIDDNEQAQLKLLCDEVFGEENFVAELPTIMNLKGNNDEFGFSGTHEYTIVYAKNKENCLISEMSVDEEGMEEWREDEFGFYKQGANLEATGANAPREKRPNLYFPVFVTADGRIFVTHNNMPPGDPDSDVVTLYPITNNQEMSWRWSKEKFIAQTSDVIVSRGEGLSLYKKQRPEIGDFPSKKPKTLFYKPEYSSGNGTTQIKSLFGHKIFQNPKPKKLIEDFLRIGMRNNDCILDFFAGSGTTAHAVMQLNAEDGGNRRYICVQWAEETDARSEARKAGYPTIFDITQARIEKAAAKIRAEHPDFQGDLGFKIFETVPGAGLLADAGFDPAQADMALPSLNATDLHTLLTTWRVHDGQALTDAAQPVDLAGYTAYWCGTQLYVLHAGFDSQALKALVQRLDGDAAFKPERVVFYGPHMASAMQHELHQAITGYANKKSLNMAVLARY